ncbi:MAG: hypothetical protein ACTHL8_01065 [Burkholderiaceae bacterium]
MLDDHDIPRTDALPSGACIASPGAIRAHYLEANRKLFETLRAMAKWNYDIDLVEVEGDDGRSTFVASLFALTRTFRSLPEVQGWLHALDGEGAPRGEIARFAEGLVA